MYRLAVSLLLALGGCTAHQSSTPAPASGVVNTTPLIQLDGKPLPADTLAGKVVVFVNVASTCGYTPQYEGLQALYEAHQDDGLVIVGVPCNQFGGQEPGTAESIATFCKTTYGVTFPLLEKQAVNGPERSALYQQLVGTGDDVRWNFEKFVVGRDGTVQARFPSGTAPDAAELRVAIEQALSQAG